MIRILTISASALALSLLSGVEAASKDSCRALVMSGGANKGAYEVGVIYELSHLLDPEDVAYDVVSGVSAGALNAGAVAMYPPEKGKEMSEWLQSIWLNMTSDKIYKDWPNGFMQGLFNESGVYDNSPLVDFVTNIFNQFGKLSRKITVSAVDVGTGEYVTYSDADVDFKDFPMKIIASASIPFVFPHRHIDNRILMDGGTTWNTNLVSAVDRCMELVDSHEKITMDIIICSNDKITPENTTSNSVNNYLRYRSIKSYNQGLSDVYLFQQAYENVNFRYFFIPSQSLAWGLDEMKFDPEIITPMIETGKADAQAMLNKTSGYGFKKLNEWMESQELKKTHPHLSDYLHQH